MRGIIIVADTSMWKKYNNKIALALAAILVISSVGISALVFPKTASASCGGGYAFCRAVNVCLTSQCPANQTNFTVLICANATMGNGNACATVSGLNQTGGGANVKNSNGYDITFWTSSNCTGAMNWETEKYVASTGELEAYVLIPSLLATGNTFYMCYGNSGISTFQGGSTGSAWDSNYAGIWHLPNGSSLSLLDSTSNANNGTPLNSPTATTGQIDGGIGLVSASTQYADFGSSSTLNPFFNETIEAWVEATSFPNAYNSIYVRNGGGGYSAFYITSANKVAAYINASGANLDYDGTGLATLSTNTWYYVVFTYTPSTGLIGYVNAVQDGSSGADGNNIGSNGASAQIGNDSAFSNRNWNGVLDEVRVSSVARSANWITTDYNNQSAPNSFESFGSEQTGVTTQNYTRLSILNSRLSNCTSVPATFGYNVHGGSTLTTLNFQTETTDTYLASSGTVNSISFWGNNFDTSNHNIQFAIYNGTTLIASTPSLIITANSSDSLWTVNFSSPVNLVAGNYNLAYNVDSGNINVDFDTNAVNNYQRQASTFGTWQNPATWGSVAAKRQFSIFANEIIPVCSSRISITGK